jgi:hypothetical protein
MRGVRLALAALAFVAGAAWAQAVAPAEGPLAGFGWFADLAGSCWKGTQADGRAADTQCYSVQHERLLRGTIRIHIERPGGAAPIDFEGDSVFAYEPAAKKVVYTQWGSDGSYATGEMVREGDTLFFSNRRPDGAEARVRFAWRRVDADSFKVTRERKEDAGWKEVVSVVYRRAR